MDFHEYLLYVKNIYKHLWTVHFRYSEILTWLWWFGLTLDPVFATAPAALKILLATKVTQK